MIKKLTIDQKAEIVINIYKVIEAGIEKYKEIRKKSKVQKLIINLYRSKEVSAIEDFEIFIKPIKINKDWEKINWVKEKVKNNNFWTNYEIIKTYVITETITGRKSKGLMIARPYYSTEHKKEKFNDGFNIFEKYYPECYKFIIEKFVKHE